MCALGNTVRVTRPVQVSVSISELLLTSTNHLLSWQLNQIRTKGAKREVGGARWKGCGVRGHTHIPLPDTHETSACSTGLYVSEKSTFFLKYPNFEMCIWRMWTFKDSICNNDDTPILKLCHVVVVLVLEEVWGVAWTEQAGIMGQV